MSLTKRSRWNRRPVAYAFASLALAACENGGGEGAGGSGGAGSGGPSGTGGGTAFCSEAVNSVPVIDGATTPHIVRTDTGYMLAVLAGGEVTVLALDESADVLHGAQISSASGLARTPSVSASAGGFTVLWAQGSDIFVRPLDASGQTTGPAALVGTVAATEPRPAGASTGSTVAATWMDGATSSVAGVLSGNQLSQAAPVPGWFPAIATSSGGTAVAWSQGGTGGVVQVALLGALSPSTAVPGSSSLIKSLTAMDGDFVVGWEEVGGGAEDLGLARVHVGGSVVAQTIVAPSLGSANWPSVAWSGERLAVAFYQFREALPAVFVAFYDASLVPVDGELRIADDAKYPSVAWGPSGAMVAYASQAGGVEVSLVTCP